MNLAFFIARRTAQRTPENKPGVMERIAVISVALSVAVMLLAMAVIMGFKQEVSRKVAAFSGHAVVNGVRGVGTLDSDPVRRSARAEELIRTTEGFVSLAPYAVKGGIVRTADAVQGVMLKGVDGDYDWSSFGQWLVEGELPRVGDSVRTKDILLSRGMAEKLMLGVGDKVEMLFVETGDRPRRDRFKVAGIYSSGMVGRRDIGLRDFHLGLGRSRRFRPQARTGPALRRCRRHGEPRREQRDGALSQYFRLAEGP